MTTPEPQPAVPPPSPPFQFSLRTLLLLFVVLGSSMAVFGGWGIVVFGLVVGLAIFINRAESLRSLAWAVPVCILAAMLLPAVEVARESGSRASCANNLKEIAFALQNYQTTFGHLPPAYVADKNGKPTHSWRVMICPFLEHYYPRYHGYKDNEPWDGPNNKKLTSRPMEYACPADPTSLTPGATQTSYLAVVGSHAAWAGDKPRKLADFGNDASTTIMLAEVANSNIAWTEPKDLLLDSITAANGKSATPALTSSHARREEFFFTCDYDSCINVAMADGSVRFLRLGNRSAEDLRKLLQIGGCKEDEIGEPERHPNWPNIAALAVWLASVGTLLTCAVRSRKPQVTSDQAKAELQTSVAARTS